MRFSINIPNFGDFADPSVVARVASAAEAAGWDALFVWDHVVHEKRRRRSFGDPFVAIEEIDGAVMLKEQVRSHG